MSNTITVLQLNEYVDTLLKRQPALQSLHVIGELSNIKFHSSGHIYFTLKSADAAVSCVMFRSAAAKLTFVPSEGQEVIVDGSVQLYVKDGKYQFYASNMSFSGEGALYKEFARLKQLLEAKGYFQDKKPVPDNARKIGVVTSPTGAVIRDIINVATRRNPGIEILLYPVQVQGAGAAEQIAYAIRRFNEMKNVDVIIVGRGGGSIEDLWAFNELPVAEAIYASELPVISAVGHQTDFTIADFVADLRAPTPSAAAEVATQDMTEAARRAAQLYARAQRATLNLLNTKKREVASFANAYPVRNVDRLIDDRMQETDMLAQRLDNAMKNAMLSRRNGFDTLVTRIKAYSPQSALDRGYAIVTDENGKPVTQIERMSAGSKISLKMRDGQRTAVLEG